MWVDFKPVTSKNKLLQVARPLGLTAMVRHSAGKWILSIWIKQPQKVS